MKIKKKGINPKKEVVSETCPRCKCEFEYNSTDVKNDNRDGDYVVCPTCGTFLNSKL